MRIYAVCLFFLGLVSSLFGQGYAYSLKWSKPHLHTFQVELSTTSTTQNYTDLQLPVWRPGSYVRQDYAAAVSAFEAAEEKGNALRWEKIAPNTWRVYHNIQGKIRVRYRFFANKQDAGSSRVGAREVFFNPVNMFMYVSGRLDVPVRLTVQKFPGTWQLISPLQKGGTNLLLAKNYHEFVDGPVVLSERVTSIDFDIDGTKFYIHFLGDFKGGKRMEDEAKVVISKICQSARDVMGSFPFPSYHFIYRLVPKDLFHAVEHTTSSIFSIPSNLLYGPESFYQEFAQVTAHELWHVWNVKSIRPQALMGYDYGKLPFTNLHWFTEGVTDYFAEYLLLKAGIIDQAEFLLRMSANIETVENNMASRQVSPADASVNSSLVKSDYMPSHLHLSYYDLGKRLGLLMDLDIRKATNGEKGLDDLFRLLEENYGQQKTGLTEAGLLEALQALSGQSWDDFFAQYVHGTKRPPYKNLFAAAAIQIDVKADPRPSTASVGFARLDYINQGVLVRKIRVGSDAHRDGLNENDLILEINGQSASNETFNSQIKGLSKGSTLRMKVFRNRETQEVQVKYQGTNAPRKVSLQPMRNASTKQKDLFDAWLGE